MTPHAAVFGAKLGAKYGPAALALLYVVAAAGGEWTGPDAELAALMGCSLRQMQKVRSALVAAAGLAYSVTSRGGPRTYRVPSAANGVAGAASVTGSVGINPDAASPPPSSMVLGAVGDELEATQPPTVPVAKKRKPLPSDPLFDAIVDFAYGGVRPKEGGRIAKLANEMLSAGLTADRFRRELPAVVVKYAAWRQTLDLGTITACWRWILSPPAVVGKAVRPSEAELAAEAMQNGNPWNRSANG